MTASDKRRGTIQQMRAFKLAAARLASMWYDDDVQKFLHIPQVNRHYPFPDSFDELVLKIDNWLQAAENLELDIINKKVCLNCGEALDEVD